MKVVIADLKKTEEIAKKLVEKISKRKEKTAQVIGLEGELGSGKTTFAQFFAGALGIKKKIQSPTFVIVKNYKLAPKNYGTARFAREARRARSVGFDKFIHIDAYRIKKPKEILELGWRELISNPQSIILIEWADRIKKILPKKRVRIKFQVVNDKTRKITI